MSALSYRIRQPAWLWAIGGSLLSGLAAAAVFSLILMLVLLIMGLGSTGLAFTTNTGTNWPLFALTAIVIAVSTAAPIIALVSAVSALALNAVRKRQSRAKSNLLAGYEWLIWASVFVAALTYPWIAKPIGFDAIWGSNYYDSAFPFLLVLAISLACAAIARPLFFGIVSHALPAENVEAAASAAPSPGGHAHAHA